MSSIWNTNEPRAGGSTELPWLHLNDQLPRFEEWNEEVLASLGLESTTRHEVLKQD